MAARFWVGGTGTWDASDTTHWSSSSGGAGGASVPGSADTVTLNGSSGGGTVTVNTTVTVTSLDMSTFTGTLDFSANNNDVTLSANVLGFNGSGTSTRTLNLGNGIWTLSGGGASVWGMGTTTGLTFNANSSTLRFTGTGITTFTGGGLTYATIDVRSAGVLIIAGANTIGTLLATPQPTSILFPGSTTTTIINAPTLAGSGSAPLGLSSTTTNPATVSIASGAVSFSWAGIRGLTFTGGAAFEATDSLDLANNSGITITPPAGGGGSSAHVIGG